MSTTIPSGSSQMYSPALVPIRDKGTSDSGSSMSFTLTSEFTDAAAQAAVDSPQVLDLTSLKATLASEYMACTTLEREAALVQSSTKKFLENMKTSPETKRAIEKQQELKEKLNAWLSSLDAMIQALAGGFGFSDGPPATKLGADLLSHQARHKSLFQRF